MLTKQLGFLDAVYIDGYLWFSALGWNAYYKVNVETGEIVFLGEFKYADLFANRLFYRILKVQQYIFFIPWFFNYLVRLDTETLETEYWKVPKEIEGYIAKFRTAYICNGKIVLFPMYGNVICFFDLKTLKFECDVSWNIKNWKIDGDFMQGCQVNDAIYSPVLTSNLILKYNLNCENHELITFSKEEKGIVRVVPYNSQEILVLSLKGNIWKYQIASRHRVMLYQYKGKKDCPYSNMAVCGEKIYIFPAHEEDIILLLNGKINHIAYPTDWRKENENFGIDWCMSEYWIERNSILLYPILGNMVLNLDIKTDKLEGVRISKKTCFEFLLDNIDKNRKLGMQERIEVGTLIWEKMTL